jgi:hypothetical protein
MAGGRPTKLTPEVQKKIVEMISAGNYVETAAAYAGISKVILYDWMKRGNNASKGIHREFLDAIQKALAESEIRDVLTIGTAAKLNWQAAAWRLERKSPAKWGRKTNFELNPMDEHRIKIDEAKLELMKEELKLRKEIESKKLY